MIIGMLARTRVSRARTRTLTFGGAGLLVGENNLPTVDVKYLIGENIFANFPPTGASPPPPAFALPSFIWSHLSPIFLNFEK